MGKKKSAKKKVVKKKVAKQAAATGMIEPGKSAKAFSLPDQSGRVHKLKDYAGRWLVIYFYPKDNTSGCTKEACQFRDELPDFEKVGASVLGVSPDSEKSHAGFAEKYELPFPLLADTEKKMLEAYGVWQEKSMYGRKYMGVVRTTYLIDPKGKVAARWDKVKVPGHASAVRDKIRELTS